MDDAKALEHPRSTALAALLQRGFVEQVSDATAIDQALAEGMVTFYIGFDPTATSLHVGNLVCIMAMRLLQQHGHRPLVLIGGGTARVGDPSGRSETRKLLDDATLETHVAAIGRQFGRFLHFDGGAPNDALVVDNQDWLAPLRYIEFLRDIGVHFTVNRMIATKTYRERIDNELPLSFLEFNYQLFQAYDFLHLYREHGCRLQLGGSDQWGNIVAGVELIRRIGGGEHGPAHCLTFPLLTTADGRKMGKTERGAVWLDPEQTSPFDYFQYWVSCDDSDVRKLLLTFTDLPVEEIDALCQAEGAELREVKQRLAFEATCIAHGRDAAERAQRAAQQAFGGGDDWSAVPAAHVGVEAIKLVDLVTHDAVKAFPSKRQARQRIESGAVRIDGDVRSDPNEELLPSSFPAEGLRLQAGKRCRFRVLGGDPVS
ncbi:tyrosine--tRNA ligase [Paraliomyxa miuraensis]|uniref:tyrosine--tRNA ligase n=1 Tax=Paraliomyxa miuraensis TaxID=376150 RepID=UPI002256A61C|nr:tyrosine--tRNA ligase [Paraliomyxa miuraensis]MCX4245484.1 tyrosine--tRNA ligase [Paraliomyxa miuraensis]